MYDIYCPSQVAHCFPLNNNSAYDAFSGNLIKLNDKLLFGFDICYSVCIGNSIPLCISLQSC